MVGRARRRKGRPANTARAQKVEPEPDFTEFVLDSGEKLRRYSFHDSRHVLLHLETASPIKKLGFVFVGQATSDAGPLHAAEHLICLGMSRRAGRQIVTPRGTLTQELARHFATEIDGATSPNGTVWLGIETVNAPSTSAVLPTAMSWVFAHPDAPEVAGRSNVQKELIMADIATEVYSVQGGEERGAMLHELSGRSTFAFYVLYRSALAKAMHPKASNLQHDATGTAKALRSTGGISLRCLEQTIGTTMRPHNGWTIVQGTLSSTELQEARKMVCEHYSYFACICELFYLFNLSWQCSHFWAAAYRTAGTPQNLKLGTDYPKEAAHVRAIDLDVISVHSIGILCWRLPPPTSRLPRLAVELLPGELNEYLGTVMPHLSTRFVVCDDRYPGSLVLTLKPFQSLAGFKQIIPTLEAHLSTFVPSHGRAAVEEWAGKYEDYDFAVTRRDLLWRRARAHGSTEVDVIGKIIDEPATIRELREKDGQFWADVIREVLQKPSWKAFGKGTKLDPEHINVRALKFSREFQPRITSKPNPKVSWAKLPPAVDGLFPIREFHQGQVPFPYTIGYTNDNRLWASLCVLLPPVSHAQAHTERLLYAKLLKNRLPTGATCKYITGDSSGILVLASSEDILDLFRVWGPDEAWSDEETEKAVEELAWRCLDSNKVAPSELLQGEMERRVRPVVPADGLARLHTSFKNHRLRAILRKISNEARQGRVALHITGPHQEADDAIVEAKALGKQIFPVSAARDALRYTPPKWAHMKTSIRTECRSLSTSLLKEFRVADTQDPLSVEIAVEAMGQLEGPLWRALRSHGTCYTPKMSYEPESSRLALTIIGANDPGVVMKATNAFLADYENAWLEDRHIAAAQRRCVLRLFGACAARHDQQQAFLEHHMFDGKNTTRFPCQLAERMMKHNLGPIRTAARMIAKQLSNVPWHVAGKRQLLIKADPYLIKAPCDLSEG